MSDEVELRSPLTAFLTLVSVAAVSVAAWVLVAPHIKPPPSPSHSALIGRLNDQPLVLSGAGRGDAFVATTGDGLVELVVQTDAESPTDGLLGDGWDGEITLYSRGAWGTANTIFHVDAEVEAVYELDGRVSVRIVAEPDPAASNDGVARFELTGLHTTVEGAQISIRDLEATVDDCLCGD